MPDLPFLTYGRQDINDEDIAAVVEVLRGDWLTTGPAVEAFEAALSQVTGGHPVVAVNSGTAALHAAYAAAGVGPGTTVVVPAITFAATASAAVHLGADVVFADLDDDTLLIDVEAARAATSPTTKVIAPVDYAGQPADVASLLPIAESVGAVVIEDAAHSIGGTVDGRPVGDQAHLTTLSFHPVKTVTTGEGGAVVVKATEYLDEVLRFRNHGLVRDVERLRMPDEGPWHQEVQSLGLNYRLPDILCALGTSQLRRLDQFVAHRAALVARYRDLLSGVPGLRLVGQRPGVAPGWHLFPVRVLDGRRREVFERLRQANIGTQVHYLPVHLQPLFADLGHKRGHCPVAEAAYEQLLSLPLHFGVTEADQDRVVEALTRILA